MSVGPSKKTLIWRSVEVCMIGAGSMQQQQYKVLQKQHGCTSPEMCYLVGESERALESRVVMWIVLIVGSAVSEVGSLDCRCW